MIAFTRDQEMILRDRYRARLNELLGSWRSQQAIDLVHIPSSLLEQVVVELADAHMQGATEHLR